MATEVFGVILEVRLPVDRFSAGRGTAGCSLVGAFEAVASGLASSLEELEAFEEEWLRWCFEPVCLAAAVTMSAWDDRDTLEQAKHVQAPLRRTSLTDEEIIIGNCDG